MPDKTTIDSTRIVGLLVDDLSTPSDIGASPTFSWRMESARPGAAQSAYRIRVFRSSHSAAAAGPTLVWDSGAVESQLSVDVPFAGAPLLDAMRYSWSVSVRDERGEWLPPAESSFSTGLFSPDAWNGSIWISAADATANAKATSSFAKTIRNPKRVAEAWWCCTGLGVFEASVNGSPFAPEALLKPGFTTAAKTKYSFCREVTRFLEIGEGEENTLSADVSTGWWNDEIMQGFGGEVSAFRAVLILRHGDGTETRIGTGTDWRTSVAASPVTAASIFYGEDFDARLAMPNARTEQSKCEMESPAIENTEFRGAILPMQGPVIGLREDIAIVPVSAYAWRGVTGADDEHYGKVVKLREGISSLSAGETLVIDFGQNCAAVPEFSFSAAAGTTLSAHPAEMLNDGNGAKSRGCDGPEGSAYVENYRSARATARYTFSGNGVETYRPSFTFFGGRYLTVTADGPVEILSVRWIPVCSIPAGAETASFVSADATLNRFVQNVLWGQRSNYLSVPTDCPQRDERCGWTADTHVFTKAACYNADVRGFLRKWLRDLRDSQRADGAFPGAAPLASHGARFHQLGWGDAGVLVPWILWRHFGDRAAIEENWDAMVRFTALIADMKYASPEAVDHQWADWLSREAFETKSGRAYVTGKNNTPPVKPEALRLWRYLGGCYWIMDADAMADMAAATGRDADAPRYRAMAAEARDYMRAEFVSPEDGLLPHVFRDMQTPALFALKLGFLDEAPARAARDALVANIRDHGFLVQTGFLGTFILMDTLVEVADAPETAYSMILNRGFPSWLYSVDQGATTIWERWNSYTKADGLGDVAMNSFNHYAYGAVFGWMMGTMAGIREDPSDPGFRHFVLAPIPDKRLGSVAATYRSPYGTIESAWRYGGDRLTFDFTIPANTSATVKLPGLAPQEFASGRHTLCRF